MGKDNKQTACVKGLQKTGPTASVASVVSVVEPVKAAPHKPALAERQRRVTMSAVAQMRFTERLHFACLFCFASSLSAEVSAPPKSAQPLAQTFILDGIWGSHSRWERLRSRITASVGPCTIWRYDNSGRVSIESLGAALASELKRIVTPVNLVGYSMGGLVVREALRQTPGLKVRRVALLNSPNYGSAAACLLPLSACREMRPGSAFLKQLNAAPWTYPTLATWCPYDLVVFPGSSGRWKKASIILRSDVPMHLWPVMSVEIHRSVTAFLASDEESPFPAGRKKK